MGFDPAARRPTGPAPRQTLIAPTNSSSQLQWWQGQGCAKTGEPQDSRPTGRIARQSIPSVGTSQPTSGKRAFPCRNGSQCGSLSGRPFVRLQSMRRPAPLPRPQVHHRPTPLPRRCCLHKREPIVAFRPGRSVQLPRSSRDTMSQPWVATPPPQSPVVETARQPQPGNKLRDTHNKDCGYIPGGWCMRPSGW